MRGGKRCEIVLSKEMEEQIKNKRRIQMKKIEYILVAIALILVCLLSLVACGNNEEIVSFHITFDSQGGSSVSSYENIVEKEPIPTKEGYVFSGWYLDKYCDGERITFPYSAEKDLTLYAKWDRTEEGEKNELIEYIKRNGTKDGNKYLIISSHGDSTYVIENVFGYDTQNDYFVMYSNYVQLYGTSNRKKMMAALNIMFKYNQFEKGISVLNEISYSYKFTGNSSFTPTGTNLYTINNIKVEGKNSLSMEFTPNSNNKYSEQTQKKETDLLELMLNSVYEFANNRASYLGITLK